MSKLDKARFALQLGGDVAQLLAAWFDAFDGNVERTREHIRRITPIKPGLAADRARVDAELAELRKTRPKP